MRNVRTRRRGFIDARRITIGDYIVLFSGVLLVLALFLPWFNTTAPGHTWAFVYSQVASVIIIVFFLATLFLVIYPALSRDLNLPSLSFSTPVVFLTMGALLLLLFFYEAGRYACDISCTGFSRGIGIWVGLIASLLFITGAIIKWGSRSARPRYQ